MSPDPLGAKPPFWQRLASWLSLRGLDPRDLFRIAAFLLYPYPQADRRLPFRAMLRDWFAKPVPTRAFPFLILTASALFLLAIQALTGVLLAVYYRSAPGEAYASVQHIVTDIRLGWFIHQVHAWGANLLILAAFLFLALAFINRSDASPRELGWKGGVLLFFLLLCFGFTGRLLPWDNAAYWSTAVGTGVLGHTPVLGGLLLAFLRGEASVGASTLSRFYAFHVTILPWMTALLVIALFLIARRLGYLGKESNYSPGKEAALPFYPDFVLLVGVGVYLLTGLLLTLAILAPLPLGDKANVLSTPVGIKPPWYFLGAYQFVHYLPASLAVTLLLLGCLALLLWPLIQAPLVGTRKGRHAARVIGFVVIILFALFTLLGYLSERTLRLGGSTYQFDFRAFPHRVK